MAKDEAELSGEELGRRIQQARADAAGREGGGPPAVQFSTMSPPGEAELGAMAAYSKSEGPERIVRGALLEAQLTDWPSVGEVARTSGLVLGGVIGTASVVSLLNLGFGKLAELAFPV